MPVDSKLDDYFKYCREFKYCRSWSIKSGKCIWSWKGKEWQRSTITIFASFVLLVMKVWCSKKKKNEAGFLFLQKYLHRNFTFCQQWEKFWNFHSLTFYLVTSSIVNFLWCFLLATVPCQKENKIVEISISYLLIWILEPSIKIQRTLIKG